VSTFFIIYIYRQLGYSSYHVVTLTINILTNCFSTLLLVYHTRFSQQVAILSGSKSLLYGSLFGNTMCVINHQLLKWYSKLIKSIQRSVEICQGMHWISTINNKDIRKELHVYLVKGTVGYS
jgi:hypothetical protein